MEIRVPSTNELLDLIAIKVKRCLEEPDLEPRDVTALGNLVLRMRIRDDIQEDKKSDDGIVAFPALPPRQLELFQDAE